jgi:hypothetical protein
MLSRFLDGQDAGLTVGNWLGLGRAFGQYGHSEPLGDRCLHLLGQRSRSKETVDIRLKFVFIFFRSLRTDIAPETPVSMPGERFCPGNNPGGSPGEVRLQKEFDTVKSRPTQNKTPLAWGQSLKIKSVSESEKIPGSPRE